MMLRTMNPWRCFDLVDATDVILHVCLLFFFETVLDFASSCTSCFAERRTHDRATAESYALYQLWANFFLDQAIYVRALARHGLGLNVKLEGRWEVLSVNRNTKVGIVQKAFVWPWWNFLGLLNRWVYEHRCGGWITKETSAIDSSPNDCGLKNSCFRLQWRRPVIEVAKNFTLPLPQSVSRWGPFAPMRLLEAETEKACQ